MWTQHNCKTNENRFSPGGLVLDKG